ncbi:hypothetical protein [Ramlibacter albus]|uniref:Uncharacterized protein n=1 Tax=Ramlibacter albus TaxID=2079448 RepID=A0A923M6Y7_9BURK|nr:hypothetical protein [Ramlibacter albus]MBC5764485.1 hypothetical protein [Ramlibacter albus]
MSNTLTLSLRKLDESTTRMEVSLAAGGFAGRASCFVDPASLSNAANEFAAFPLRVDGPAVFESGYLSDDMAAFKQVHVEISARPLNTLGIVGLRVVLALPVDAGIQGLQAKLDCVVPTTYQRLQELSNALATMVADPDGQPHILNLD